MTKKTMRRRVDRGKASTYEAAADEFFRASEPARELGHWTAAGLLLVHGSIAYADALCIALSGQKSSGEHHGDAVTLLEEAAREAKGAAEAAKHLAKIINEKNRVAYEGLSFRRNDVDRLVLHAKRFQTWAKGILKG